LAKRSPILPIAAAALACLALPLAFVKGASPVRAQTSEQIITYVPINPQVFVKPQVVATWAAQHNEAAVRAHAAALWSGLTALTNQSLRGVPLAVFDTWFTPCDIYPVTKGCGQGIISKPTLFEVPEQFFHLPRLDPANVFSSVKYDEGMKHFVEVGYGGAPYTTGAGLVNAINAGLKNLPDTAKPSSMMLKPTYELLSSTKPTAIMYWKGPGLTVPPGSTTSPDVPASDSWLQVVLVDPTGKATNAKPITYCANVYNESGTIVSHGMHTVPGGSYKVVPLSEFYAIPLTSAGVQQIQDVRAQFRTRQESLLSGRFGALAKKADPGCPTVNVEKPVAALMGMHVASAELHNVWTWQTFWWQPFVSAVPGAKGPFRHFDFATAYWKTNNGPYDYRYAFNPYLEAVFGTSTFLTPKWTTSGPGGVTNLGRTTNCISCHETATYTVPANPSIAPGYVAHGSQPQVPTTNSILARNLWSLADRAGHPSPTPAPSASP
jgi:hypothetical protein